MYSIDSRRSKMDFAECARRVSKINEGFAQISALIEETAATRNAHAGAPRFDALILLIDQLLLHSEELIDDILQEVTQSDSSGAHDLFNEIDAFSCGRLVQATSPVAISIAPPASSSI